MTGVDDCAGCGTGAGPLVPSPACRLRFEDVLAREFADPDWCAPHPLTVAAYQLQHPDGCTDRTLALTARTLAPLLRADSPARLRGHVRRTAEAMLRNPPARPRAPRHRGTMTIADVLVATNPEEHGRLVRAWAAEIAAAWER